MEILFHVWLQNIFSTAIQITSVPLSWLLTAHSLLCLSIPQCIEIKTLKRPRSPLKAECKEIALGRTANYVPEYKLARKSPGKLIHKFTVGEMLLKWPIIPKLSSTLGVTASISLIKTLLITRGNSGYIGTILVWRREDTAEGTPWHLSLATSEKDATWRADGDAQPMSWI